MTLLLIWFVCCVLAMTICYFVVVVLKVLFLLTFNASLLEGGNEMLAIAAACFLHGAEEREQCTTVLKQLSKRIKETR